jgi:hypothetical protein
MNPSWIKAEGVRLAIIPRPRRGDWLPDDISLLQRAGVDVVVSALTAPEAEELGLLEESEYCQNCPLGPTGPRNLMKIAQRQARQSS